MAQAWVWSEYRGVMQEDVLPAWVWGQYKGELPKAVSQYDSDSPQESTPLANSLQHALYLFVGLSTGVIVVALLTWLFSPASH